MSALLHVLAESAHIDDAAVQSRDAEKPSKIPEKHRSERMDTSELIIEDTIIPEPVTKAILCQPEVSYTSLL